MIRAIILLLTSWPLFGAISIVQSAANGTSTSGTTLATSAISTTTGNLLAVGVYTVTGSTTSTITDTAGNTFTALTQAFSVSSIYYMQWFYAKNITGNSSDVVTLTWGAS